MIENGGVRRVADSLRQRKEGGCGSYAAGAAGSDR